MKKNTKVLALLLVGCLTRIIIASSYYIPDIGASAMSISRGNIRGLNDSSSVLLDNPGALNNEALGFSSFYASFMQGDSNFYTFTVGAKLTSALNMGIGYSQLEAGQIPITDINSSNEFYESSSASYFNRQVKGALSYAFSEELSLGVAGTLYEKRMTQVGHGINMDIGLQWHHDAVALSLSGHEILPTYVTYDTGGTEPFASLWTLAGSYTHPTFTGLTLFGQVGLNTAQQSQVIKSIGFSYDITEDHLLSISGSYRDIVDLGKVRQSPAFGIGLSLEALRLEYVVDFSDSMEDNTQHYVSVTFHMPSLSPIFSEK